MSDKQKQAKDETVIFRAPGSVVQSLDRLAKLIGGNRSEALRRLIPDLSSAKPDFSKRGGELGEQFPEGGLMARQQKIEAERQRQLRKLIESSAPEERRRIRRGRREGQCLRRELERSD